MGNQQRSPEKGNAQRLNALLNTGKRITSGWLSVMVDYLLNKIKFLMDFLNEMGYNKEKAEGGIL